MANNLIYDTSSGFDETSEIRIDTLENIIKEKIHVIKDLESKL